MPARMTSDDWARRWGEALQEGGGDVCALLQQVDKVCAPVDKACEDPLVAPVEGVCGIAVGTDPPEADLTVPLKVGLLSMGNVAEFSTFRGTVSVSKGKWMYETVLLSNGLQQIGWATHTPEWTKDLGVGDFLNSYAFDGSRVKKWNITPETYGSPWEVGDVVGSCIDLDRGSVCWYVNGQHQGTAYADIDTIVTSTSTTRHEHLSFTPAVSMSDSELSGVNFGALPFLHPIPGYAPMQGGQQKMAELMLPLTTGLSVAARHSLQKRCPPHAVAAVYMKLFQKIFKAVDALRPVYASTHQEYPQQVLAFVWGVWIPFLEGLQVSGDPSASTALWGEVVRGSLLGLDVKASSSLWQHTIRVLCFQASISHHFDVAKYPTLLSCDQPPPHLFDENNTTRHPAPHPRLAYLSTRPPSAAAAPDLPKKKTHFETCGHIRPRSIARETTVDERYTRPALQFTPCKALHLLNQITQHRGVVDVWFQSPTFNSDLILLCQHKQPNASVKRLLLPSVWWQGAETHAQGLEGVEAVDAEALKRDMEILTSQQVAPADELRTAIISQMLQADGSAQRVMTFLERCCGDYICPFSDAEGASLTRLFFILLPLLIPLDSPVEDIYPPASAVGRPYVKRAGRIAAMEQLSAMERLGGLLSHLKDTMPPTELPDSAPLHQTGGLFERLACVYQYCVRRHIARSANYLASRTKIVSKYQVLQAEGKLSDPGSLRVIVAEIADATRRCSWEDVIMASVDRGKHGVQATKQLFALFLRILVHYDNTAYFPFLPNFILEALVTIVHYRRKNSDGFRSMIESEPEFLPFLIKHLYDERIIYPDLRDTLLGAVASVLDMGDSVVCTVFRRDPGLMRRLVSAVLKCFQDKQTRFASLSVLIRLSLHLEFGKTDRQALLMLVEWNIVPEPPQLAYPTGVESSVYLCQQWYEYVVSAVGDLPAATSPAANAPPSDNVHDFVKELFNRIGWAVSELSHCLSEQQDGASMIQHLQHRKRAGMMIDLTRRLFQVLEVSTLTMTVLFLPNFKSSSDLEYRKRTNLRMLVEVVLHMLQTYTDDSPQQKLSYASRVKLLTPVTGCIINMLYARPPPQLFIPTQPIPPIKSDNPLLHELATTAVEWSEESFRAVFAIDWENELELNKDQMAKVAYAAHPQTMAAVSQSYQEWIMNKAKLDTEVEAADDADNLCCICYCAAADTKFSCGHMSCRSCITRQLVNSNRCFFCNAEVTSINPINRKISAVSTASLGTA
eukprot:TRINITY_DN1647_c0_g1_i1.p1 TRINITY_DN1647_c0_g1~~TRINITY_DN1647_c0_g1_i1.p1  ORF type:complete len:1244 (+),score=375.77 TRINITY_DN1647_c0_g1_i1:140-3871(+)